MTEAAIYRWQDDKGVVHFTDNSDSIPVRYESRVREVAGKPASEEKPKAAEAAAAQPAPPAFAAAATAEPDRRLTELQAIRTALPEKRKELAQLRRKWVLAKGRNPDREEIEEYEKKRAKGEAKPEDNPYINKNPLSSPGPARVAYYKKLEEIRKDEERIRLLESELAGK